MIPISQSRKAKLREVIKLGVAEADFEQSSLTLGSNSLGCPLLCVCVGICHWGPVCQQDHTTPLSGLGAVGREVFWGCCSELL